MRVGRSELESQARILFDETRHVKSAYVLWDAVAVYSTSDIFRDYMVFVDEMHREIARSFGIPASAIGVTRTCRKVEFTWGSDGD